MEFGVLGPLQVDGVAFEGSPKQRVLLISLLLARGAASDARLIESLWGERAPRSAAHALQVYVSELRRSGFAIERESGGYRLALQGLDADRFEQRLRDARALRAAGRLGDALSRFDEALGLWRGAPFADLASESFAAEAGRFEELRLSGVEDRAECALELGRATELVPELEALVAAEPLRERLRRALMLALYRSGRQAEALEIYAEGRRVFVDELGLEPGEELRVLQAQILRQDAGLQVEPEGLRLRRHLPAPLTDLIGRREHVEEVGRLLRGTARLVTLTGPGGAGKTRVALRAAHELADAFPDGVWFVGLAALTDPELVRPTLARALGATEDGLEDELRDRELLVLLDNFEQLLPAAPLVGELLQAAPRLRVLATSRTPLRVYGEQVLPVPPLPEREAGALFVERARAVGGMVLAGHAVAQICARLDRLPLGIELVAARSAELTEAELVASLARRLELASQGPRDLPERQQTLRAAIGWSHELLSAPARELFAELGAFAGGFSRDDVQAICGDAGSLSALVQGSLVSRAEDGRYGMLETIREYAVEQLDARRDGARVRRRHAEHFLARAEALGAALGGEGVDEAYASFELEHDNFRAALAFTGAIGLVELRFRLASAVAHFWLVRGHLAEGRSWLEQTLAMQKGERIPPVVAAQVLRKLATLEWRQEDLDLADEHAQAALPLLDSANDDDERYRLLILLGCIDYSRRNPELARDWWEQSATLARSLENEAHLALALTNLAVVATELKDYAGAAAIYEESVASARRAENREYLAGALAGLGDMHLRLGEHEAGRAELIDSMALYAGLGFRDRVASCCIWLAPAPEHDGDNELAARLVGASFGIRNQTGSALDWQEREFVDELVPRVREALGAGGYDRAFAEGEAAPDEVVREVLASRVSTLGA